MYSYWIFTPDEGDKEWAVVLEALERGEFYQAGYTTCTPPSARHARALKPHTHKIKQGENAIAFMNGIKDALRQEHGCNEKVTEALSLFIALALDIWSLPFATLTCGSLLHVEGAGEDIFESKHMHWIPFQREAVKLHDKFVPFQHAVAHFYDPCNPRICYFNLEPTGRNMLATRVLHCIESDLLCVHEKVCSVRVLDAHAGRTLPERMIYFALWFENGDTQLYSCSSLDWSEAGLWELTSRVQIVERRDQMPELGVAQKLGWWKRHQGPFCNLS